tara:strand:+ start:219 stop:476 length:258 start_codon:yes stop_codon:yes gene_type:complete
MTPKETGIRIVQLEEDKKFMSIAYAKLAEKTDERFKILEGSIEGLFDKIENQMLEFKLTKELMLKQIEKEDNPEKEKEIYDTEIN